MSQAGMWRIVGAVLLVGIVGCTNANVPLNSLNLPPEKQRRNTTPSAVFADVRELGPRAATPTTQETEISALPGSHASLPADHDGYFVGLCLSGGGSRSANFSAACMFELERLGLLQKVDYISSVSGGSLAAAYYCVNDRDWNPANAQKKLTHPFATDLFVQTLALPWNWVALTFTDLDRSDLLANSFRDVLYSRDGRELRYSDLRPDRPRLLINATDLQSGRRFVFCNESFDDLNSDLSRYPLAYAVAASAAVPVILHPVTLRDYSTRFKQYRHMIDGGVSDNLGLQTLTETYAAQILTARRENRPDPYPNGAVIIIVDAHTQFDARLSDKGDVGLIESLTSAIGLTSTMLLNRVSSATLSDIIVRSSPDAMTAREIRDDIRTLNDSGFLRMRDRTGHDVTVVYIALAQVNDLHDVPFESFRESINSIATYFNISEQEAYRLYEAASLLMKEKFEARLRLITRELNAHAK
jgi:predicted acylesterase/phospholipase RssA